MCYQRSTFYKIAGGQELGLLYLFPADQSENAEFAAPSILKSATLLLPAEEQVFAES